MTSQTAPSHPALHPTGQARRGSALRGAGRAEDAHLQDFWAGAVAGVGALEASQLREAVENIKPLHSHPSLPPPHPPPKRDC